MDGAERNDVPAIRISGLLARTGRCESAPRISTGPPTANTSGLLSSTASVDIISAKRKEKEMRAMSDPT